MVFDGVFERHPKLTVLMSELGIDWLAPTGRAWTRWHRPERAPSSSASTRSPLRPSEYVRRNIRLSPLPAPHESPVATLEALPEVAGVLVRLPALRGQLGPASSTTTRNSRRSTTPCATRFLSGNIAASYALHGRPAVSHRRRPRSTSCSDGGGSTTTRATSTSSRTAHRGRALHVPDRHRHHRLRRVRPFRPAWAGRGHGLADRPPHQQSVSAPAQRSQRPRRRARAVTRRPSRPTSSSRRSSRASRRSPRRS